MPVRPENLARYPAEWPEISRRIRFERAGVRCECRGECGLHRGERCEERHGEPARNARGVVILTTAHRDHVPENVDESNLFAACQRCHLRYDRHHHERRRGGGTGASGAMSILEKGGTMERGGFEFRNLGARRLTKREMARGVERSTAMLFHVQRGGRQSTIALEYRALKSSMVQVEDVLLIEAQLAWAEIEDAETRAR